ncbi:uncharacterized protein LOC132204070 [Neocloeon triangulifer]|uniref:uncharacterized protein LOC132204070 n=1 Tax=Neocloeon triangulifer TaxID=2078957 RepID=UPI00286F7C21|nr:uncharacterized protein LOC132204070 [Neocloeon triangulifer]
METRVVEDTNDYLRKNKFLLEFREFFIAMKCLGWLPWGSTIRRVDGQPRLVAPTWAKIYCLSSLSFVSVTNAMLMVQAAKAVLKMPEHVQFFGFLYVATSTFTNFIPLLTFSQRGPRRWFMFEMYEMQKELERCSLTGGLERINFRGHNRLALAYCLLASVTFLLVRGVVGVPDLWRALGSFNEGIVIYWLVFSALFMKKLSSVILDEYTLLLELGESGKGTEHLIQGVLTYRKLWLQLLAKVRFAGNVISMCVGTSLIVNFGRAIFAFFYILRTPNPQMLSATVPMFLISASVVTVLCQFSHGVKQKIFDDVMKAIEVTKMMRIPKAEKIATIRYFSRISKISPPITFNFYLDCDRKLLSMMIVAVIANSIILVQMNVSSEAIETEDFKLVGKLLSAHLDSWFYQLIPKMFTK